MCSDFVTEVPAKWILSGEHAVLRGHPALVFPMPAFKLTCHYWQNGDNLVVTSQGKPNQELQNLVQGLYTKAMAFLGKTTAPDLSGKLDINTDIPIGQGMGASAALCVALARWFVFLGHDNGTNIMILAHELEHAFHGKSSGLDIAGVAASGGIWFINGASSPLTLQWQPKLYLSNTGMPGVTTDCIRAVGELAQNDPLRAVELDKRMGEASWLAKNALSSPYSDKSLCDLTRALVMGRQCFLDWQLYSVSMHQHEAKLKSMGAVAVKPTGSGKGGCFISLWADTPPENTIGLYPLFV